MKILIPVACPSPYTTAIYVHKALLELGHDAKMITQAELYGAPDGIDLFFGVDSAGGLDFPERVLPRTAMWFIDSRRNCTLRSPGDDEVAKRIADGGGWVFQAQRPDWVRNVQSDILRSTWLPLGADPGEWKPMPEVRQEVDVAFCGNIWDERRRLFLEQIGEKFSLGVFTGLPAELSARYSGAKVGFNISSFYGSPIAYDVNMRVFEVMSCAVPLVTNFLPELVELGIVPDHHCLIYHDLDEALSQIRRALGDDDLRARLGTRGRRYIVKQGTYVHRMNHALEVLTEGGVIK